ncbi:MAG: hypothetical protein HY824_00175 [Acidobacteria bacterium]|nr:hypothetical protein [Acidobacteriota bacterium]
MSRVSRLLLLLLAMLCVLGIWWPQPGGAMFQWLPGSSDAGNDAIRYRTGIPSDAVARLQRRIDAGTTELQFDAKGGYLDSVLQELKIPVSSQTLVFSKTSGQRELISPARPRALYFHHDVYVGWVQGGRALEIASMDPNLGAVFYTLSQEKTAQPTFQRQTQACLQCHDSPSLTSGVPGLIVKSVYPDKDGEPIVSAGTFVTSDQSPLKERWGGWYVTGTHGTQVHMGNAIADDTQGAPHLNLMGGANVTDLSTRIDTQPYLSAHSDIVALMVLEHQSRVHNLITRASYRARMALYFDEVRNTELRRSAGYLPDSTLGLVRREAEPLVRAMLFVEEAPLTEPVSGTSGFSRDFASQGPRDHKGRSLLDLDLTQRLFRYPCSYLIYSESFDALPVPVKDYVYRRLWDVLSGEDASNGFAHLSRGDRTAIMDILLETKPDFAAWRTTHASR